MAQKIRLNIITPQKQIEQPDLISVSIPGQEGDLGIYENHSALMSTIRPGIIVADKGEEKYFRLFVKNGFVEVDEDVVTVIADFVESIEDIDIKRAEDAQKRAQERLSKKGPDIDIKRATDALSRADLRLKLALLDQ